MDAPTLSCRQKRVGVWLVVLCVLTWGTADAGLKSIIPAPQLSARSYILVDHLTSSVLAEHNADERLEPASLTKIMTVYVAGHALQSGLIALDDEIKVSEKAWRMEGSRMFIEVGKRVSVDDLLQGVIVQSGNDASVALAEHISGTEDVFASIMTDHARKLGMTNSNFSNSTGLPDSDTYTTAKDMALLSSALIREFPELYARFDIQEFTYNNIRQLNRNRLLVLDKSADGLKTGHTEGAGYCLVSSAERDGVRLISAVMGSRSETARTEASLTLINYGYRFFETRELYRDSEVITTLKIWKGAAEKVDLGPPDKVFVTIPRGRYDDLEATANIDAPLIAPVSKGQTLGRMVISLDGEQLAAVPLVALDGIDTGSFFSRLYDNVMLIFE
ncbi:MAG: D-alanyl-D-alanine carboxypeptidase [Gammaproteobacteria bacterium]|nr:D-alanyl-D-alanine carboxypeptidase [Gammaproteobacteria bacterium]